MNNPIEFLYFYAKLQPDAIAIQSARASLTYAQLLAQVRAIAGKLRQLGVRPGQVVVTSLQNQQTDWTITLALMHEAAITCSKYETLPVPADLNASFVVTEKVLPEVPSGKTILIDAAWFNDLPAVTGEERPFSFGGDDGLFRLILTSGTTGHSKAVALTVGALMHRVTAMTGPSFTYTREIGLMGMATAGGIFVPLKNLVKGLTYFVVSSLGELIAMTKAHQVECISGTPDQMSKLIEEMKRTSQRLTSLKIIWYGGSAVSPRLLDAMRQMICANVACWYGSTEIGSATLYVTHDSSHISGMTGYVPPEVTVEIVDADHQTLGFDQEGVIRVKGPGGAKEYYNNPEETQRSFRDGWFYPGDRGRLLANGALVLAGRESELINRSGTKIAPTDIDQRLLEFPGIIDAAAFGFENHLGAEDVCAALVVAEGFDMAALQVFLGKALASHLQPSLLVVTKEIPRNAMGKILRPKLTEQHGETLRKKMAALAARV